MAQDAEKVFEQCSPAVVQLKSLASEGSGIIIDSSGLILTNLHVVATSLPCTVSVTDKTGKIAHTLEGAVLHKVHPSRDLAILKVKGAGAELPVAVLAAADQSLRPASTCFSISSPAGTEGALTNTFTQGMISTPSRLLEGEEFIQFSAPVNAGSSGGALLSREGKLIGVITAKQEGAEGLAFAIPIAGIDLTQFVEPKERKGNEERHRKAVEYAARARMAGGLRMFSDPGGRLPEELNNALHFANLALTERPASGDGFLAMIEVFYLANMQEACLELSRAAHRATGQSDFLRIEARSLRLLGKEAEARATYLKALEAQDGQPSPIVAAEVAAMLAKEEPVDWPRVAYLCRWAVASAAQADSTNKPVRELLKTALGNLEPAATRALLAKKHPFTLQEMDQFPSKLPEPPPGDAALVKAFDPAHYKAILASSSGLQELPPENSKARIEKGADRFLAMEDPIDDVIPAAGGRIALLVSKEKDTVYLYDVARANVLTKMECPKGRLQESIVVGGLDHWALINKSQMLYERFKLLGGGAGPEVLKPNKKLPWNAVGAVMSPYRDDLMWLILKEGNNAARIAIDNFESGVIRVPDASAIDQSWMNDWINHSHPRFKIDSVAMTCAPAEGGRVILAIDAATFSLVPLQANYVPGGLDFPFGDEPASWVVGKQYPFRIRDSFEAGKYGSEQSREDWARHVIQTNPFYGAPWLVQLCEGRALMIRIMNPDTGRSLLPVRPVPIPEGTIKTTRQVIGRPRYEVMAHPSCDRIFIFDFQHNLAISAWLPDFDRIHEKPLEITHEKGAVIRVPIRIPDGHSLSSSWSDPWRKEGTGITWDEQAGELVIQDAEAALECASRRFTVDLTSPDNVYTHLPYTIDYPYVVPKQKEGAMR